MTDDLTDKGNMTFAAVLRERLGRAVRDAWVARQKLKEPSRTFVAWEELDDFERETDCLIADAVLQAQQSQRNDL